MGDLKEDMVCVRQDVRRINERVKALEDRVSTIEDRLPSLSSSVQSNERNITALLSKVDDLENRSRRNNVRRKIRRAGTRLNSLRSGSRKFWEKMHYLHSSR